MTKRFHLESLQELSDLRLEQATRQLGELIASERQDNQRLELIQQYRDEYQSLFLEAAGRGLSPDRWHNFQKFLARLDEAVEQARKMTLLARQRTAVGQKNWLDKRGKVKAFDTLAQRFRERTAYEAARHEQKQTDEHAARLHGSTGKEE